MTAAENENAGLARVVAWSESLHSEAVPDGYRTDARFGVKLVERAAEELGISIDLNFVLGFSVGSSVEASIRSNAPYPWLMAMQLPAANGMQAGLVLAGLADWLLAGRPEDAELPSRVCEGCGEEAPTVPNDDFGLCALCRLDFESWRSEKRGRG